MSKNSSNLSKASDLIDFNSTPKIYKAKSKVAKDGFGLFAKKFIHNGQNVVVYHGDILADEEVYDMYMDDPENYYKLTPYIRGTENKFVINGKPSLSTDNITLMGVYVNDVLKLQIDKNNINLSTIKDYAKSSSKCNLTVVETADFPVYCTKKRIKKGEELTIHYGIGYWLAVNGFSPAEISDLNQKHNFAEFYN